MPRRSGLPGIAARGKNWLLNSCSRKVCSSSLETPGFDDLMCTRLCKGCRKSYCLLPRALMGYAPVSRAARQRPRKP